MPSMVYLNANAFVQLLLAAVETYPLEATGMVFGIRDIDPDTVDYEVLQVIPHLHPEEREEDVISESFPKKLQVIEAQKNLLGMTYIGGFHTHPKDDARISESDEEYLRDKHIDTVELILGIEKLEKA